MSWLVLLYFPAACLAAGTVGAWALRGRSCPAGTGLALSRWALLLFPFLLLITCLAKEAGPLWWFWRLSPLPGRTVVLPVLLVVVLVRWVGEMSARKAFLRLEEAPALAQKAGIDFLEGLGFYTLVGGLSLPGWRVRPPAVNFSKVAAIAHIVGAARPRICVEASLVPEPYRGRDFWWEPLADLPGVPMGVLKAVVAHELGHFRNLDPLRRQLLALSGCLLPWEWLYGVVPLRKFHITNTFLFRGWSAFMAWTGTGFRRWILEDLAICEDLADGVANRLVPGAEEHLAKVRSLYPTLAGTKEKARGRVPAPVHQPILLCLLGALLWAAPGRAAYAMTFGGGDRWAGMPHSWCLLTTQGADVTSLFVRGRTRPGTLFIHCRQFHKGQPPLLRCIGRIPAGTVPGTCTIEMDWEVLHRGPQLLTGNEASMSLTQSAMSSRENPDPHTAYSRPRAPALAPAGGGWQRYSQRLIVKNHPHMEFMLIFFELAYPGNYAFRPPTLAVIHADGRRQPFLQPYPRQESPCHSP